MVGDDQAEQSWVGGQCAVDLAHCLSTNVLPGMFPSSRSSPHKYDSTLAAHLEARAVLGDEEAEQT